MLQDGSPLIITATALRAAGNLRFAQQHIAQRAALETQKRFLTNANKACERAGELIKQFQTLSTDTAFELTSVELFEITNEVLNLVTSKQSLKKCRVQKIIIFEPGDFYVKANSNALHRVLLNLAKNAVKAIEAKEYSADDYVKVSAAYKGEYVSIVFEDSGTGMSEEVKRKAFEPLFSTRSKGKGGQGLGLAVVHKIITKDFNGQIDIESAEGKGTAFHILIPRAPKETVTQEVDEGDVKGGNETLLIVDDEEMILETLEEILKRFGYTVVTACNGIECVEQYKLHRPDLIVLDFNMPEMSGQEALQEIVTYDEKAKVILSSGSVDDTWSKSVLSRSQGFLRKPYKLDQLLITIRAILDEESVYVP